MYKHYNTFSYEINGEEFDETKKLLLLDIKNTTYMDEIYHS